MEQHNDIQSDILPLALMFIIAVYLITILPVQLINKHKAYQSFYKLKKLQYTITIDQTLWKTL